MDLNRLRGTVPDNVLLQLPVVIDKYKVNTPLRMAHFLSQVSHESGNFRVTVENLNYSLDGLKKVFPRYFPGNLADTYTRKPQLIANRVYANRMGNGSESSGDGWNYRGRGYIQLTGKNNYSLFSTSIGEDCVTNPDLVASKYAMISAGWFFFVNNINTISDAGSDTNTITRVTRAVNGGTIGLNDRILKFNKYYSLLR
jgi:putative chitinase